jgi:tryptophanase
MFGRTRADGAQTPAPLDLVRLAFPRRVYTQSHMDYVIEAVRYVHERRARLGGFGIVSEAAHIAPLHLRLRADRLEALEAWNSRGCARSIPCRDSPRSQRADPA